MTDLTTPAPTMTEQDADNLRCALDPAFLSVRVSKDVIQRILATHAALREKTRECGELRFNIGTLAAEIKKLRAALAEAQQDTARLDWWLDGSDSFSNRAELDAARAAGEPND